MTNKPRISSSEPKRSLELAAAVEQFFAKGGIVNVVAEGESSGPSPEPSAGAPDADYEAERLAKLEQLKGLVAKGAGVSALQYSLRMNRKEIKRLATENGLKIRFSRPVRGLRQSRSHDTPAIDDAVAGHVMHYSTLGYTVPEIAQMLDLGVRDVLNIAKAYRFEFKNQYRDDASADLPQ